jgi:hypothetical protein
MEYVSNYLAEKKLDFTLETIVKRSDLYLEQIGRKNGNMVG